MLFVIVILTFAACLFGVVAIEISMRQREERERLSRSAGPGQASPPLAIGGGTRRGAGTAPPSTAGSSRAA